MKHDPNYTLIHPTDYHCLITPFLPSPTETISDKFQFGYEKKNPLLLRIQYSQFDSS